MNYPSLENCIMNADTKPDVLFACCDWNCVAINAVIRSLREQVTNLRQQANDLAHKSSILEDEVRRRAEQMESRIIVTTDTDEVQNV